MEDPPTNLPPVPSLDQSHVRLDAVDVEGLGRVEAFVPVAAPYLCSDPDAPALLLVPGLGLDGLGFVRQLPLGALAHLHFFQTPNAPAPGEEGLGSFARYVEAYILERQLDQRPGGLVLGGASMGGAISILVAARRRVKPRALVLLGSFGSCKHLPAAQRLLAPLAYVIPMAFLWRCSWRWGRTLYGSVTREEALWVTSPRIRRPMSYYGRAVAALTRLELMGDVRTLEQPMLIAHGTRDNVLPLAAAQELKENARRARLVTIEGARHMLFFTHSQQVNAALADFLRDLKTGGL